MVDKLNCPPEWRQYWTKYPHGETMLEAIVEWVNKTNAMVDLLNLTQTQIDAFYLATNAEVNRLYTEVLPANVEAVLDAWFLDGTLATLINVQLLGGIQTEIENARGAFANLEDRFDAQDASIVQVQNDLTDRLLGYGTKAQIPSTPQIADLFFLTDAKRRIEFNGVNWQRLDGGPALTVEITDDNFMPASVFSSTPVTGPSVLITNIDVDMSRDVLLYKRIQLAGATSYCHATFQIGSTVQAQVSFGYNWPTAAKDGQSISIRDYIDVSTTTIGSIDFIGSAHDVVIWFDHKYGYLNVYVDGVLIGSWKPAISAANLNGCNTLKYEVGSLATCTYSNAYMAYPLVIAIGDSITAGAILHSPNPTYYAGVDNYGATFPKMLSDHLKANGIMNYFVVNKGVNSDTTTGMQARFTSDVISKGCKYVLIHGGINDYPGNDPVATATRKKNMADIALTNFIEPLLLGVLPTKTTSISTSHSFSIALHAEEVDLFKNYNHVELWDAIEGAVPNVADDAKMADTVHPNSSGYTAITNAIKDFIEV